MLKQPNSTLHSEDARKMICDYDCACAGAGAMDDAKEGTNAKG
jgi:hypothetical protein